MIDVLIYSEEGLCSIEKDHELYGTIMNLKKDRDGIRNILLMPNSNNDFFLLYNIPTTPIHIH